MAFKCKHGVIREKEVCQVVPEIASLYISKVNKSFLGRKGASFVSGERKRFESALLEARGDRNRAAGLLNISRATFFRRSKELGLTRGTFPQLALVSVLLTHFHFFLL